MHSLALLSGGTPIKFKRWRILQYRLDRSFPAVHVSPSAPLNCDY